jgi:hypothetical protein
MHIRFRRFQEWKHDLKTLRSGNSSLAAASDPFSRKEQKILVYEYLWELKPA